VKVYCTLQMVMKEATTWKPLVHIHDFLQSRQREPTDECSGDNH